MRSIHFVNFIQKHKPFYYSYSNKYQFPLYHNLFFHHACISFFWCVRPHKYSLFITSTAPGIVKWHVSLTPPSGCCSRHQDSSDQTNIYATTVHNRGHVLTWKGMVRLIFSPTFLMYFVLSSRGRRIFGCSKAEGSSLLKFTVILLGTFCRRNTSPKGR